MADISELKSKLANLNNALDRLTEVLDDAKVTEDDDFDVLRDASIQRFEFCFELSWKVLQGVNEFLGTPCNSPKDCIRIAAQNGLINNPEVWIDFANKRNLASHVYDEATAKEVYAVIAYFEKTARELLTVVNNKLVVQSA